MRRDINFEYNLNEEGFCVASAKQRFGRQTALIEFTAYDDEINKVVDWYVTFQIYTKRKHSDHNFAACEITGECGLDGLLFAKDAILSLEDSIKHNDTGFPVEEYKQTIIIQWENNVRKKIYCHFLPRYGFKMGMYDGKQAMVKPIVISST